MALINLARQKTTRELQALADDIQAGEVPDDLQDELESLVRQASNAERIEAGDENSGIFDLLAALDVGVDFTAGGPGVSEEDILEEGVDVEFEVTGPLEGVPEPEPRRPGGERPDPRFGRTVPERLTGTDLETSFPQPNVREEFKRLETARLNIETREGETLPPGGFFDQYSERVLGQHFIITRREFIDAQQSPGTTGMFN